MTADPLRRLAPRVDFGHTVVRVRRGPIRARFAVRTLVISSALVLIAALIGVLGLASGELALSPAQVWEALTSPGAGFSRTVVLEWRLPRVLSSIVFGAALGVSGAIFQSMTRNPLASPDIVGFSAGAYTGALIVIILFGGTYMQVAAGAFIGGLAAAVVVYLLAFARGVQGFRLIIVGIAVSAMLSSVNTWLMLTADLDTALIAAVWGAGSLNGMTWAQAGTGSALVALLLVAAAFLTRPLNIIELGDDAARALGVRTEPARLALMLLSVALIAVVTAAAGPISFVALAAPQIARRLTRGAGVSLAASAAMGAALLSASDYVALHALPAMLPVGTVTVVLGGAYLVWLLIHEARRRQ